MDIKTSKSEQNKRFNAYYYTFEATGVPEVDEILKELAAAGKSYHSTSQWNEPAWGHEDKSHIEKIKEAADNAANVLRKKQASRFSVEALVMRLTLPEKKKIAEIATRKRDEELRELKTTKGNFSPADVRIILEAIIELNG